MYRRKNSDRRRDSSYACQGVSPAVSTAAVYGSLCVRYARKRSSGLSRAGSFKGTLLGVGTTKPPCRGWHEGCSDVLAIGDTGDVPGTL